MENTGAGPIREDGQIAPTAFIQHGSRDFTLVITLVKTKLGGMRLSQVLYNLFRKNVRERMSELGLSQKDLAEKLDVTPSFVSQLLNGHCRPGLDTLENVAKALEAEASDLLNKNLAKAS